jgi:hypothetical protein
MIFSQLLKFVNLYSLSGYDMIYLLITIGLLPGVSTHLHTNNT